MHFISVKEMFPFENSTGLIGFCVALLLCYLCKSTMSKGTGLAVFSSSCFKTKTVSPVGFDLRYIWSAQEEDHKEGNLGYKLTSEWVVWLQFLPMRVLVTESEVHYALSVVLSVVCMGVCLLTCIFEPVLLSFLSLHLFSSSCVPLPGAR